LSCYSTDTTIYLTVKHPFSEFLESLLQPGELGGWPAPAATSTTFATEALALFCMVWIMRKTKGRPRQWC
jgi:hypothetical protein